MRAVRLAVAARDRDSTMKLVRIQVFGFSALCGTAHAQTDDRAIAKATR